ncbi:hypothetical protein [Rubrivirga sp.]|uniref:hypothetical protein n=1 Tax=Rubrivirga sp. TaxID=1885344 RepID=UPI003B52DCB6
MLYAILVLAIVAGSAVVGVTVAFLRARQGDADSAERPAPSDAVAEAVSAIGAQIEKAVAAQSLQGETQRQLLAQKLDTVRHTVEGQQNQVQGLRSELRHEARRRDDELAEIRHQIGAIQQTVGLPAATPLALPPAPPLADDPPALDPSVEETADDDALDASFEDVSFEDVSFSVAPSGAPAGDEAETFKAETFEAAGLDTASPDPSSAEAPSVDEDTGAAPPLFSETFSEAFLGLDSTQPDPAPTGDSFDAPAAVSPAYDPALMASEEPPAPAADPTPAPVEEDVAEETFIEDAFGEETFEDAPVEPAVEETAVAEPADESDVADEPSASDHDLPDDDFALMPPERRAEPEDPFATTPLYGDPVHGDGARREGALADIFEAWDPSQVPSSPHALTAERGAPVLTPDTPHSLQETAWISRGPITASPDDFVGLPSTRPAEATPTQAPASTTAESELVDLSALAPPAPAPSPATGSVPDSTAPESPAVLAEVAPAEDDAPELAASEEPPAPAAPDASAETPELTEDLTVITTVDAETQRLLYQAGVRSLEEIAHWGRGDARRVSVHVGVSEETIMNQWVFEAQAALFNRYSQQAGA